MSAPREEAEAAVRAAFARVPRGLPLEDLAAALAAALEGQATVEATEDPSARAGAARPRGSPPSRPFVLFSVVRAQEGAPTNPGGPRA